MPRSPKKSILTISASAYIVTVDMGYGHQRAVYPLKDIAASPVGWSSDHNIINANNYAGIPHVDKARWESGRTIYETISRLKRWPIIGDYVFGLMDYVQRIEPFYPKRDLSRPTAQVKQIYRMIQRGWGKHLIDALNKKPLPYVTSFFSTAFFAEEHGYKGDIYCLCTDTDISRAWAPSIPHKSRIVYFAPNYRVKERLMLYGIKEKNIYVTGFSLPKENIGGEKENVLKKSLGERIIMLDPHSIYRKKYHHTIAHYLGTSYCPKKKNRPLTIMFAVGGAGAQRELGATILESLGNHINKGHVRLFLVAGARNDVYRYYEEVLNMYCKKNVCDTGVRILYADKKIDYFEKMNKAINETDVLWTKPSELSFYAGLGLPIIMSPTIGSQEECNKSWLYSIGAGFEQLDARYTHEWLFDWVATGRLAEAALQGYLEAPRQGTYAIESIIRTGKMVEIDDSNLL